MELSALNGISRRRMFAAGQEVVAEGEPDVFGNVISGLLAEKKTMADGREQIVSLLFPSDFHGNALSRKADESVVAVVPSTVCVFERGAFDNLLDGFPALKNAVLDNALASLEDAREWMLLLGQKNATERVATFLLRLARRHADLRCPHDDPPALSDGMKVEIPITRAQMAGYLGLTIETVSRRLTALRDKGLIAFSDSRLATLNDVAELKRVAGEFEV